MLFLDPRIEKLTDILSVTTADEKYIGSYGYFSYSIYDFMNLNECKYNKLTKIGFNYEECVFYPESTDGKTIYKYFLPESCVKEFGKKMSIKFKTVYNNIYVVDKEYKND